MHDDKTPRHGARPDRGGRRKDPKLEAMISNWKKGEKDKWRGHGKQDGKKKRK